MNFGIDLGNGFAKYSLGKKFASKIRKGSLSKVAGVKTSDEVHEVVYEGEKWVVGEGTSFIGQDRYFGKNYEIALLTAIALASKKKRNPVEANIVVGVPVDHYNNMAEKVGEHIENTGVKEITVDGRLYIVDIKSGNVFIEGALPIKDNDDSHIITIDVGAGTVNIIEWEEQTMVKHYTNNGSFNEMYFNIAQFLNGKHSTRLNPEMVQNLIGKETMETRTGTVEIASDIQEIINNTIENILSYTTGFNFEGCKKVKVFGGGAFQTFKAWKKFIPKAEHVEDCQFVNQQVYETVAEAINEE